MEFKHFSHTHCLIPHQVPQESQITCSGCKSSGTGSIYACWICNYFLHQQCFEATRSLTIPSHPLHPLNLVPYPTYPSNSFYCNSCNLIGSGLSYSCSLCNYDLHVHCAYMLKNTSHDHYPSAPEVPTSIPNQITPQYVPLPQNYETTPFYNAQVEGAGMVPPPRPREESIEYKSYMDNQVPQMDPPPQVPYNIEDQTPQKKPVKHFGHRHPIRISEVKEEDSIICSCCEEEVIGSAYTCTKSNCDFYLHESCFSLTRQITHESHPEHPLTLLSSPPYKEHGEYTCNACINIGTGFVYNCKVCTFDLHVTCASLAKTLKREDHEHPLVLLYTSPLTKEQFEEGLRFSCDVCTRVVDDRGWSYFCEKCDFGTHVDCAGSKRESPGTHVDCAGSERESAETSSSSASLLSSVLENQQQLNMLNLQLQMSRQNAQFMASCGQSLANLA